MDRPERQAIKIPIKTHDLIRALAAHAARHGWSAFGIDRDDPPTQTAIIEEAVSLLAARREKRTKR
jgi:hypothetical protein